MADREARLQAVPTSQSLAYSRAENRKMSRLSKNILYNLFGQGSLLILSFVAVRFVFKQLGADGLGILYFSLVLSTILSAAMEMGIGSTTLREVSANWPEESAYIRDLIRTASLLFWAIYGLLAMGVYWAAPWLVANWIKLEALDAATATRVLRILGIGVILVLPRSLYASLLRGVQRMEFNNLIDVSSNILLQFGTIAILMMGGRLVHVACWVSASFALGVAAYLLVCAHFFSWAPLFPGFSSAVVRRNLAYASRMASVSLLAMVHTQADKAIASKLLPLGVVGYYGLAYTAASKGTLITTAIAQAAFPSLSALFKAGDKPTLLSQYRKLQDLLCFGTAPIFAAIPFAAVPLLTYVLDAQAARMLLLPVAFLCVGFYMNGTLNIPHVFSLAVGKPGIAARSNFYALFVVLPMTFALVYFFGVSGAAFSWVFYHLFAYAYAVPRICSDCLGTPVWSWYAHVLQVFALVALTYGVAWTVLAIVGTRSNTSLLLAYALASLIFVTVAYLRVGAELREAITRFPRTLMTKSVEAS